MPTNGAFNDHAHKLGTPEELDHWRILYDVQARIQILLNKPGSCPWHLCSNLWHYVTLNSA
jgi:hypothetical protein